MNLVILDLVLFGLATFRIAHLLVWESGPGKVFPKIRNLAKANNLNPERAEGFLAGVFSCIWCMSVWVGFFFTAFVFYCKTAATFFAFPFALSAIALLIREYMEATWNNSYD